MTRVYLRTCAFALAAIGILVGTTTSIGVASATVPTAPDTSAIKPVRSGDLTLVEADRRGVVMQNGGGLVEDINSRLNTPSYIVPAGTVARRMVPMMRTTPPFFPRKSLRFRSKGRKSRKAKKQKRSTRRLTKRDRR